MLKILSGTGFYGGALRETWAIGHWETFKFLYWDWVSVFCMYAYFDDHCLASVVVDSPCDTIWVKGRLLFLSWDFFHSSSQCAWNCRCADALRGHVQSKLQTQSNEKQINFLGEQAHRKQPLPPKIRKERAENCCQFQRESNKPLLVQERRTPAVIPGFHTNTSKDEKTWTSSSRHSISKPKSAFK